MKNIISPVIIFLLLNISLLYSQVTQEWEARYNGPMNSSESAYAIAVDKNGNSYVTGSSYSFSPRADVVTIKYNSDGVQEWIATYNSPIDSSDFGWSIAVDDSSNVYVAAESYGAGTNLDYTTIKYNSSGIQQWVVRYNGTGNSIDVPKELIIDHMGYVYVMGYSYGTKAEIAVVKYNSAGTLQWAARYTDTNSYEEYGRSVSVDAEGNVYVAGDLFTSLLYCDYVTIKYNSYGVRQWVALYDGTANRNDQAYSIKVNSSGYIYVTGRSEGINSSFDIVTLKYNKFGQMLWEKRYDGLSHGQDNVYDLDFDYVGNIYIGGLEGVYSPPSKIVTIKYDTSGVLKWVSRYEARRHDRANCMKVDSIGNVYTGGLISGSNSLSDFITLKYNGEGSLQWTIMYNGPANSTDAIRAISINNSGNVWVTGVSGGNNGPSGDFCTIKYSQIIGIQPVSSEIPTKFSLSQNYPNPFNPTTNIEFSIPQNSLVVLKIFDVIGREIKTLVNEYLSPGTYKVEFDALSYPSGVYYYRIISENYSETKKLILLK
ncbi:MAG: T9SS C-terminal target domain-containing protein [Ignavibacteriae bacterium]|nr:MAG: T9SS C-terminal target domain-containing protein [Ignavibacteriota bacterium]